MISHIPLPPQPKPEDFFFGFRFLSEAFREATDAWERTCKIILFVPRPKQEPHRW